MPVPFEVLKAETQKTSPDAEMRINFVLFFSCYVNAGIKEITNSFANSIELQNGRSVSNQNVSSSGISSDGGLDLKSQKQRTKSERYFSTIFHARIPIFL
jgi:hypothetical protein